MPDTTMTVGVNVENLEEVKELREELEKIRDLKKEIDELGEDETHTDIDPFPSPEPDNTRQPRFYVSGKNEEFTFDDDETIKAATEIDI